eukprot:801889-Prorocentrum_minimum.AAC.2
MERVLTPALGGVVWGHGVFLAFSHGGWWWLKVVERFESVFETFGFSQKVVIPVWGERVMASTGAKKVLNSPDEVVYEMLDGFVQTNPGVVRLDGFPDVSTPA